MSEVVGIWCRPRWFGFITREQSDQTNLARVYETLGAWAIPCNTYRILSRFFNVREVRWRNCCSLGVGFCNCFSQTVSIPTIFVTNHVFRIVACIAHNVLQKSVMPRYFGILYITFACAGAIWNNYSHINVYNANCVLNSKKICLLPSFHPDQSPKGGYVVIPGKFCKTGLSCWCRYEMILPGHVVINGPLGKKDWVSWMNAAQNFSESVAIVWIFAFPFVERNMEMFAYSKRTNQNAQLCRDAPNLFLNVFLFALGCPFFLFFGPIPVVDQGLRDAKTVLKRDKFWLLFRFLSFPVFLRSYFLHEGVIFMFGSSTFRPFVFWTRR